MDISPSRIERTPRTTRLDLIPVASRECGGSAKNSGNGKTRMVEDKTRMKEQDAKGQESMC